MGNNTIYGLFFTIDERRGFMTHQAIKTILLQLCTFMFFIIFSYILYDGIFNPYPMYMKLNPFIIILGVGILLVIFYLLIKGFSKLSKRTLILISIINFSVLLVLQFIFLRFFQVNPSWDFGMVYNGALSQLDKFNYFSFYFVGYYPNNIPLLMVETLFMRFFKLFGVSDYLTPLIAINMFIIFVSLICTYWYIYRRYNLQTATLFSFFFLLITPFYAYVPIVYTDTFSMVFPIVALLLYHQFYHDEIKNKKLLIILGIWLAVGTLIKANVVILLIALLIHYFMTHHWKTWIRFTSMISIFFISTILIYKVMIYPYNSMPRGETGIPSTHWIMMGLNNPGGYDDNDAHFSMGLKNGGKSNEEIKENNIRVIKERIHDYGFTGMMDHFKQKINYTWSDGTYYSIRKLIREPLIQNHPYADYVIGNQNKYFIYVSQISHITLIGLMLIGAFRLLRQKNLFESILTITIIGVFLFLLLWETRSRYLVLYLPIFLALAAYGAQILKGCDLNVKNHK